MPPRPKAPSQSRGRQAQPRSSAFPTNTFKTLDPNSTEVIEPANTRSAVLGEPVLVAGFGSIGRRHVRNLKALGCNNFVFYRTRQGTIDDEELAQWPAVTELQAAMELKPRLAIVSNPSAQHVPVALAAARAGCDLFIEKPLSASLDGCDELAAIVRERKLITMIGCNFRFHPLLLQLRSEVQAGRIGQVVGARAEWGEYLPDWHPWEDHRKSYSARADMGGGVILTLIHPLDYLYWIFGPVADVHARTRAVPSLETPAGEDWADISLRFASGVQAQVHLDYLQRPPVHRLSVWGDRGRATWDYHAGTLLWEQAGGSRDELRVPGTFERNEMYLAEMREFLNCVRTRRQTSVPLMDGVEVLKAALRAKAAAHESRASG